MLCTCGGFRARTIICILYINNINVCLIKYRNNILIHVEGRWKGGARVLDLSETVFPNTHICTYYINIIVITPFVYLLQHERNHRPAPPSRVQQHSWFTRYNNYWALDYTAPGVRSISFSRGFARRPAIYALYSYHVLRWSTTVEYNICCYYNDAYSTIYYTRVLSFHPHASVLPPPFRYNNNNNNNI